MPREATWDYEVGNRKIKRRTGAVKKKKLVRLVAKKIRRILKSPKRYNLAVGWAKMEMKKRKWDMEMLERFAKGEWGAGKSGHNHRGRISQMEMAERRGIDELKRRNER